MQGELKKDFGLWQTLSSQTTNSTEGPPSPPINV